MNFKLLCQSVLTHYLILPFSYFSFNRIVSKALVLMSLMPSINIQKPKGLNNDFLVIEDFYIKDFSFSIFDSSILFVIILFLAAY